MSDRRKDEMPPDQWRRELAGSMRRLTDQLSNDRPTAGGSMRALGEQLARTATQEALYHATRALDRVESRHAQRRQLKEARRRERAARASAAEGYVSLVAAALLLAVIFALPAEWWLIFISLALMFRGARILGRRAEARAALPVSAPAVDSRAARIDEVCDRLLAALKDAPPLVRELLSSPEQTVNALRKSCHELLRRETALRALANPEEAARLDRERAELEGRIARETDDIVRSRLHGALTALDHQRAQHAEVVRSANRLEAERTRLGYTLDGLYAQVMRVRTADAGSEDVVGAGLRHSLDQLRDEVGALADAVEQVNRVEAPIPEPSSRQGGRVRS